MDANNTVQMTAGTDRADAGKHGGIASGVQPGDEVVTDGQEKLQAGSRVAPQGASKPVQECPCNRGQRTAVMSISRPFILRPIATSLLMAALLLVGIVAYRQLPISALAAGGLPNHPDRDVLSGRQP